MSSIEQMDDNISFMKDAMNKHEKENMLIKLKQAKDKSEREKIVTLIIKPYFRLTEDWHGSNGNGDRTANWTWTMP